MDFDKMFKFLLVAGIVVWSVLYWHEWATDVEYSPEYELELKIKSVAEYCLSFEIPAHYEYEIDMDKAEYKSYGDTLFTVYGNLKASWHEKDNIPFVYSVLVKQSKTKYKCDEVSFELDFMRILSEPKDSLSINPH